LNDDNAEERQHQHRKQPSEVVFHLTRTS
jgi:hypothetical protein